MPRQAFKDPERKEALLATRDPYPAETPGAAPKGLVGHMNGEPLISLTRPSSIARLCVSRYLGLPA